MKRHGKSLVDVLVTGTAASLLSTAATAGVSRFHTGRAASGGNGPSQWLWGRRAARRTRTDLRHTAAGYLIHHASSLLWASVYESGRARTLFRHPFARAAGVTLLASLVDYKVVPRRFTPGWEARLPRSAIAAIYATFAAGLSAGARIAHRR